MGCWVHGQRAVAIADLACREDPSSSGRIDAQITYTASELPHVNEAVRRSETVAVFEQRRGSRRGQLGDQEVGQRARLVDFFADFLPGFLAAVLPVDFVPAFLVDFSAVAFFTVFFGAARTGSEATRRLAS